MELATRLAALVGKEGMEQLAAEAAGDNQGSYFAHLQALLSVTAPLATAGWALDLHPASGIAKGISGPARSPDLRATRRESSFAVEVKCLGRDDRLTMVERFTDGLKSMKIGLELETGHGLDVTCAEVCSDPELGRWAAEVREAVRAGNFAHLGQGTAVPRFTEIKGVWVR